MITDPKIERYIYGLVPARDSVLTEMEEYAEAHKIPIIGPAVGRFLATLVMISKARRILSSARPSVIRRFGWRAQRARVLRCIIAMAAPKMPNVPMDTLSKRLQGTAFAFMSATHSRLWHKCRASSI
jgi:hypothetical protein